MNPTEANVDELLARRESIRRRLEQLSVPSTFSTSLSSPLHPSSAPSLSKRKKTIKLEDFVMGNSEVPIVSERTKDTHWSYLLKEMQWLSADFVAERKRHKALQKKLSHQVHTFFQTAESRRFKRLAQAEVQRRRLAHKISRDHVLKFWQKMERVIAFQQKATYEQARQTAMNQQLVKLVKITETYTTRLQQQQAQQQTDDRISAVGASITDIEKALQSSTKTRRSKHRIRDYAQFHTQETVLYGESTEELSGGSDDSTYSGTERDQELDDETTFLIAEREQPDVSEELRNLLLEKDMDIQQVLERLHAEGGDFEPENEHIHEPLIDPPKPKPPTAVGGDIIGNDDGEGDADDDMDASDVEDYEESAENSHDDDEVDNESEKGEERRPSRVRVNFAKTILGETNETDSSEEDQNNLEEEEEFVPEKGDDVDDETTMKAEEQLPRDMSYQQELELLKTESEIPIEQLRAMYQQSIQNSMSKMEEEEEEEEEESEPYESAIEDDDGEDQISGAAQLLGSGIANDDQDEYVPDPQDTVDDETTMEAEEKLGRDMSYQEEIAMLQRENEMSVEELKAMVAQMAQDHYDSSHRKMSSSAVQEKGENDDVIEGKIEEDDTETSSKELSDGKRRREDDEDRLVPKKKPRHETMESISNAGLAAMDKLEVSAELARKTLASRPFLIPSWVKLREYQQIGLNWLLSLQTRRLNGILADEMGLGKTLQTIALFAYLAAYKGIWGPHLIVVPTSVILNWETELKRFCPAFKVLCYYGPAKRRKELRQGWTKSNWYHVVVTSYQLAVQDAFAFKRKRWYYLVLDEAQHIKNFQSQRWQTLINFNSQRRLLLTGTPLQNSLMELWSLLHFLMPYIFRSRKEFSYWFANPMTNMIEDGTSQNENMVNRLHGIIRPFVLRRLKKDVETQLPGKFEHIVKCQLSRRQMFIYEEFMARSSTRQALRKGGNFMGMMNVLMQLRKVCNHPDLFEPRSVVTPMVVDPIILPMPSCVFRLSCSESLFAMTSHGARAPLWCGSCGEPSLEAALRHDTNESLALRTLEALLLHPEKEPLPDDDEDLSVCSTLRSLAQGIEDKEHNNNCLTTDFINYVCSRRCRTPPFVYPKSLLDLVAVSKAPLEQEGTDIMTTPSHLLAMRRNQQERANDLSELIRRFVFCVPKAGARPPVLATNCLETEVIDEALLNETMAGPLQECLAPFREAHARLSSYFPDKKLVQFDAGKLQALAELLRERKRGGHKVLIFTQMSKMLDILEDFLNLNGHTYLRLDGSTSVDRRQRLMDRFNNDPKVFCFILSTRSGGVGINLTGADTVVFYDSDWNPAQDAQAQDRAHRIGQTREVHIYRLITEHSVEENILTKARQKKNLDILVMDRGKFDASILESATRAKADDDLAEARDLYSKGGLRAILGVSAEEDDDIDENGKEGGLSTDQIEKTMESLEDVEDVVALRGVRKEAADELKEFDETVEYTKDSDAEDEEDRKLDSQVESLQYQEEDEEKTRERELEKEFAAWQEKAGMDPAAVAASLCPAERYALRFREEVDPFYSVYAVMEYRRKLEAQDVTSEVDIDKIEEENIIEERRAMDDGDLLATDPRPEDLVRQRDLYRREKARRKSMKKLRKLTGDDWELRADALTKHPFWYNIDTGEALWDKPKILLEMEEYQKAWERGWDSMPPKTLVHIMSFLIPFPDRMVCARVCSHWRKAAMDISFIRHVYPVEMGAYSREESKMEYNHYRSINDAIARACPGDTIELGDGHYWQNSDLIINFPVRFVGDEHDPSNVVVELSGTMIWNAPGGFCEGITFRRPKLASDKRSDKELLRLQNMGKLHIFQSVFDNDGCSGPAVRAMGSAKGRWNQVIVCNGHEGIILQDNAKLELIESVMCNNVQTGILCSDDSAILIEKCKVDKNGGNGLTLQGRSIAVVNQSRFMRNKGLVVAKEADCVTTCTGNICSKTSKIDVAPPGFKFPG